MTEMKLDFKWPYKRVNNTPVIDIHNTDCMNVMKLYPDKHFELAIIDPPYGINAPNMQMGSNPNRSKNDGYGSGPSESTAVKLKKGRLNSGGGKLKDRKLNTMPLDWDFETPSPAFFSELFRVSQNQIIWGGNYFDLPPTRCIICWDKMQPWDNFSQWEMAWTSFDRPAAMYRYSNTGGANKETKIHPTQKPVNLYKWLLKTYAKTGDKIYDSHMGSGASAIAALDAGYDYTASEISEKYFLDACERIHVETLQQKLF